MSMVRKFSLFLLISVSLTLASLAAKAQCSICTRTAQQLGERPAKSLNAGVIYLAIAPLMIVGLIGYRWWQTNENKVEQPKN